MRTTVAISLALAAMSSSALLSACTTHSAPPPQPDATITCMSAANCDDHTACTIDNCDVSGVCTHTAIDSMCPSGQHCVSGTGCTAVMMCNATADCDDMIACTVDSCGSTHTCTHTTVDSLCTNPMMPICNATSGCVAGSSTHCTSSAMCDDMVACTVDACGTNMMCTHTPIDSMCPSGQRCTSTGCAMIHTCTTVADCMNPSFWNFCDGVPTCSTEFGCMTPTPRACNDSNPCTIDSCDRTSGSNGACVFACDRSMPACSTDPACPQMAATCAGHFELTPAPMGACSIAWNAGQLQFTNVSGALSIQASPRPPYHFGPMNPAMTTNPAINSCPTFNATAVVAGGCEEHYSIMGTFSDDNTLSGTVTVDFVQTDGGSCDIGGCTGPNTYPFTATRIP